MNCWAVQEQGVFQDSTDVRISLYNVYLTHPLPECHVQTVNSKYKAAHELLTEAWALGTASMSSLEMVCQVLLELSGQLNDAYADAEVPWFVSYRDHLLVSFQEMTHIFTFGQ